MDNEVAEIDKIAQEWAKENNKSVKIKIRKENITLSYGSYKTIYCKNNVIIFERKDVHEKFIIIINNNYEDINININFKCKFKNIINLEEEYIDTNFNLPPMGFKILKVI